MTFTILNSSIAKDKLILKSSTRYLDFYSTLWKGEVIMLTFNNLTNSINQVISSKVIDNQDFKELEKIIKIYAKGYCN